LWAHCASACRRPRSAATIPSGRSAERSSELLIISGARDSVVSAADQAELLAAAQARGTRVVLHPQFADPFMDRDPAMRAERLALVHDFLE
jgi:hypothetical protein